MKVLGMILLFICGAFVLLVIGSVINHNYHLWKEAKQYPAPGKLVEVNDRMMHVYGDGEGEYTLVFMSGSGTSNPTLDFKPLWKRLIDEYRIVVVEKAGYGWSETSSSPRDIDIMLAETRRALELAGEEGPYILVPHSMSGLEAIYWAQTYPDEVRAIIGLDPTIPDIVEHSLELPSKAELNTMYVVSRIGLSRFMPSSDVEKNFPLMKSDELSGEDKDQFLAMFYKSSYTKNMLNEVKYLQANAMKVKENDAPTSTPMFFFITDGEGVAMSNWRQLSIDYVSGFTLGKYESLDCGHYVHHENSETIADMMRVFLKELDN